MYQRLVRSSDVPITDAQRKSLGNWALVRYFGWGFGLMIVLIPLNFVAVLINRLLGRAIPPSGVWFYIGMIPFCLVSALVGTYAHYRIRQLPWWRAPEPTETEKARDTYQDTAGDVWIGFGIAFFGTIAGLFSGVYWFYLAIPAGAGWSWLVYKSAKAQYQEYLRLKQEEQRVPTAAT